MLGIQGVSEPGCRSSSHTTAPDLGAFLIMLPLQLGQLPDVEGGDHQTQEERESDKSCHFGPQEHSVKRNAAGFQIWCVTLPPYVIVTLGYHSTTVCNRHYQLFTEVESVPKLICGKIKSQSGHQFFCSLSEGQLKLV